ncbi:methyltransferase family protein [Listeria aquatica]|uniref:methyltransferase family protein n=1 Tax=Listeria aquatica TaxID=1494960 RepID=UPI0031F53680
MYGIKQKTLGSKWFTLIIQLVYLTLAVYLIVRSDLASYLSYTLYLFLLITFIRLNAMSFIWLPRGISWKEAIGNSTAFAIYYIGFPLFAIYDHSSFNLSMYLIGIALFLIGSFVNTTSELLRKPFKDNPANKGKLYTGGFFKYAIHINYFGDVLWVAGFALVTLNWWALTIPVFLLLLFMFSYIPNADNYLLDKYGKQFEDYQKNTKKLIPFIW